MSRGRPPSSDIRQRLVEILSFLGKDYGYNIYKVYCRIFPKISMRLLYYHLNKGAELGEFEMERVAGVEGNYSWGSTAEKVFYSLGPNAMPIGDERVKAYFTKLENKKIEFPKPRKEQEY